MKIESIELSREETSALIKEYQESEDDFRKEEIEELIIQGYIKLVVRISKKFTSFGDDYFEDYLIIGCNSLTRSMKTYNFKYAFSTYCYQQIWWRMETFMTQKKNVVKKVPMMDGEGGCNYESTNTYDDFIKTFHSPKKDDRLEDILIHARRCLDERELDVIKMRLEGFRLKDIGAKYSLSQEAIGKTWRRATVKIKKYMVENNGIC